MPVSPSRMSGPEINTSDVGQSEFIEEALVHQRRRLVRRHQLRLEAGILPVVVVVTADIPGDHPDLLLGLVQLVRGGEFLLQVGGLFPGQLAGQLLEPAVDLLFVHRLRNVPAFVDQRHHRIVGHRLGDRVSRFDQAAELRIGVAVLLHDRRAREGDETRLPHAPAHLGMPIAVLPAMPFVHEHEGVLIEFFDVTPGRGLELVDHRRDDVFLVIFQQFHQVSAGPGLLDLFAAVLERVVDLVVQIDPVGDQHDLGIADLVVQGQALGQHDHRQRLAAALRMPDDAAQPAAVRHSPANTLENVADAEVLLIAGDLFLSRVKQNVSIGQIQQSSRPAQRIDQSILLGDLPRAFPLHGVEVQARVLGTFLAHEKPVLLLRCQRGVDGIGNLGIQFRLSPEGPEFLGRARRAEPGPVHGHRQEQLGVKEKVRNAVVLLVADVLADGLRDGILARADVRFLALDDRQGDSIHEKNDIRPVMLAAAAALDGKLLRDVIDVVLRLLPVDVLERVALGVAQDGLLQALAQAEKVVDLFVGADQPIEHEVLQRIDPGDDVVFAEGIGFALGLDASSSCGAVSPGFRRG